MASNLLIVESPAKSKTIKKYLGEDFEIKASYGHVADLPKKNMGIDIENNFSPTYAISSDKKKVIADLKRSAKKADKVRIATDEDREGEAIGRHVCNALELPVDKTPRIVFHEITKSALQNAVKNPRTLDMELINAQQARRILDRIVGFELSPVLWKKIKYGLSAGRVQSVAVRLIVEREREIQNFDAKTSFTPVGTFQTSQGESFEAKLNKKISSDTKVKSFLESCQGQSFVVKEVDQKPGKKYPSAPFTTSTLQQEASRKLGLSVGRTMQLAQRLYEAGHITYMRTDSINISKTAVNQAQKIITDKYGEKFSKPTHYTKKSKGAQEAHECVRPTNFNIQYAGADPQQQKLYNLIRKRTIASQMTPAQVEKTKAIIDFGSKTYHFIATGEVVTFEGFLKVYVEGKDDEEHTQSGMLPPLSEEETMKLQKIIATETFQRHPPRYTEASLVKELEKQGIGRPSTYAPTISTIQKRNYIVRESRPGEQKSIKEFTLKNNKITTKTKKKSIGAEKKKLFPTDMGMVVTDFLLEHFPHIMEYAFTAEVEEQFDTIAEGKLKRQKMITDFYGPFHSKVEKTLDQAQRASGERILGKDPETGRTVLVRIGRYGPMVQIGTGDELDEDEKPKYSSLPKTLSIETVSLEEALKCTTLPRNLGERNGKELSVSIGRFGPYVRWGSTFASIRKTEEHPDDDPYTIDYERAVELMEEKIQKDKERHINEFELDGKPLQILNGRRGPYIKYDRKNYKIPKSEDAKALDLEDCRKLIQEQGGKSGKKGGKAKKTKKGGKTKASSSKKKKRSSGLNGFFWGVYQKALINLYTI